MSKKAPQAQEGQAPKPVEVEEKPAKASETPEDPEKRIEDLENRMAYLQAELENLQKRAARDRVDLLRFASEGVLRQLLPVVEEFELALDALRDREHDLTEGLRMVYENLMKVLQSEGLQEIEADGQAFDPYLHEAVDFVEAEDEDEGRVVEVVHKGYRLDAKILRPAQVIVNRKGGDSDD
ncbi:MAG: nucleotide exchange factor GrpE [Thermoplasmata archaeon]